MNAYELAQELHEDLQWIVTLNTDLKGRLALAINMLCQQADRIVELEKQVDLHKNAHHKCVEILQEKQNEPVAWGLKLDTGTWMYQEKYFGGAIPLYTTPQTKPLSDEEVTDVFVTCLLPDGEFDEHEFARAIEERHGIK